MSDSVFRPRPPSCPPRSSTDGGALKSAKECRMRLRWTLPAVLALFALTVASPAHAGVLVSSAPDCNSESLSQPFLRWLDPLGYTLVPGGGFEAGSPACALR